MTYLDNFSGFRNRKYCQQNLLNEQVFLCSCDLCENDFDIDTEAFEAFIQEAEKLTIKRLSAIKAGISLGARYYSLENCRKEIVCYKQLYKVGKDIFLVEDARTRIWCCNNWLSIVQVY